MGRCVTDIAKAYSMFGGTYYIAFMCHCGPGIVCKVVFCSIVEGYHSFFRNQKPEGVLKVNHLGFKQLKIHLWA